jgi:hypothetical protein
MKYIKIADIPEGSILAKDVYTTKGKRILRKGVYLDDYKKILINYKIRSVCILESNDPKEFVRMTQQEHDELYMQLNDEYSEIFKFCMADTMMMQLKRAIINHFIEEIWDERQSRSNKKT